MNNKAKLIISIIVCVVLFVGAGLLYNNLKDKPMDEQPNSSTNTSQQANNNSAKPSQNTTEPKKQLAPDFTVTDINGQKHKLSDFRGKKVFLNFWATWCGPCKMEMPEFQKAYEKYKDEIEFVVVNVDGGGESSVPKASKFVQDNGYTFPVYYDTLNEGAIAYGVSSIPATYFIDEEGYFVAYQIGALNEATLQKGINMLLEG